MNKLCYLELSSAHKNLNDKNKTMFCVETLSCYINTAFNAKYCGYFNIYEHDKWHCLVKLNTKKNNLGSGLKFTVKIIH